MKPTDKKLRQLGVSFVTTEAGISEYRLNSNSLKIILAPDPLARATAIVQHVHVGSRHEGGGNTGHSHLLEHMLFKGSPTYNTQKGNSYDQFMKRMGGVYNATTWYDRTNYFALVPPFAAAQYLAYEADRLRNAYITDEDLRTEMPVVVDEFDRSDNSEDALLERQFMATAYTEHQYRMDTIGNRAEVMKVTAAALRERLYDVYYYPNNCSVIVAGCFEVEQILTDIVSLYGHIAPSPRPIWVPEAVEPAQCGERRFVINRPGDLPRIAVGYHVPEADHPDTAPLAALGIILAGNESSRLFRKLVNKGLVSSVYCDNTPMHDPGMFKLNAKLTPGTKLETVERVIFTEIERVTQTAVAKRELLRAKLFNRNGTALMRANRLGFAQAISEHEAAADWRWGAQYDARFDEVTPEDILRVAQQYLLEDNRTVGHFVPKKSAVGSEQGQSPAEDQTNTSNDPATVESQTDCGDCAGEDKAADTAASQAPASCGGSGDSSLSSLVKQVILPNGMKIVLMPQPGKDSAIGVSMHIPAGEHNAPDDKKPVCDLVAEMLTEGSARFSKDRIAEMVAEMQVSMDFFTDAFSTTHRSLVPSGELPRYIDLLADVILNPLFRQKELDVLMGLQAARYEESTNEPGDRAMESLTAKIYPAGNPYRLVPTTELTKQLAGISTDDLRSYHKDNYAPQGTVLSLVGAFDADATLRLLESKFGSWEGKAPASPNTTENLPAPAAGRLNVNIAGKDNLTIKVALPSGLCMSSPEYLAAMVANQTLGGDTLTGRLGMEIREKRGLTYGITSKFLGALHGGGLWCIDMTTNGKKLDEALPLIKQVVEQFVSEGISESELAAEKESMIVGMSLAMDKPLQLAMMLTRYLAAGLQLTTLDSYASRVAALTKADVDAAIRKHFRIGEAVTAVAGQLPAGVN